MTTSDVLLLSKLHFWHSRKSCADDQTFWFGLSPKAKSFKWLTSGYLDISHDISPSLVLHSILIQDRLFLEVILPQPPTKRPKTVNAKSSTLLTCVSAAIKPWFYAPGPLCSIIIQLTDIENHLLCGFQQHSKKTFSLGTFFMDAFRVLSCFVGFQEDGVLKFQVNNAVCIFWLKMGKEGQPVPCYGSTLQEHRASTFAWF